MTLDVRASVFKRGLLGGLVFMILLTYALGWYDIVNNNWLTGNWFKDFYKSITYYLGWVLVYWWLFILVGGLSIGIVTSGIFAIVRAVRK